MIDPSGRTTRPPQLANYVIDLSLVPYVAGSTPFMRISGSAKLVTRIWLTGGNVVPHGL